MGILDQTEAKHGLKSFIRTTGISKALSLLSNDEPNVAKH